MSELRKVREEREHLVRGGSLEEVGKAVDDFISTPLGEGWELGGVRIDADVTHIRTAQRGIAATSIRFTAVIDTYCADPREAP